MKLFKKTFQSLNIRNYRLYFTGQIISNVGTWMQNVGLAWLVLELTNSGTSLGIVIGLQFLPILIFGPWTGVLTDRFKKRDILFITQTAKGLIALIIGVLITTNLTQIWAIYILAFFIGLLNALDFPSRQTFIHEMVGKENLMNAVSLNSVQNNLSRAIGPAIAALFIAILGMAPLFYFNAITYVAVIITLSMIDTTKLTVEPTITKIKGQMMKGLRYVKSSPIILYPLIMMSIIGTFTYEFSTSLPLMAQFTFHGNATTFALLTSGLGVGSALGGMNSAIKKNVNYKILVQNAFLFGLVVVLFSMSPTFEIALILVVLVGFFSIKFLSYGNVILQTEAIPKMRGRVMSLWAMAFSGSTTIGGPIIGFIGQHFNPRWGLALGGISAVIAAWIGSLSIKKIYDKDITVKENTKDIKI